MATQQRQYGLISDEYGFLVGSRRLEQGIESVDDKVQRIIELLEKNAKPVRVVNSQTVAQNQVAKDVSKLVALTEKIAKESQKTKAVNSQTLRGNGENRIATRPTKVVNSQTGATNASASVGSSAAELSTNQPTRTVNSQTLRGNGENRIATRPTKVVNSQTGATNASASVGSSAAELSTNQPTRTVNSQTLRGNGENRIATRPTKVVNSQTGATNASASVGSSAAELSTNQPTRTVNSQTLRGNGENRIATRPTKVVNSQTGATNASASVGSSAAELSTNQPTRTVNSQTLRGNGENRIATRPTKVVNSQTGATNASASVGSSAAELSTNQPTRTVNSQTSQQAQDRQRDANGRFVGGDGEQSKSSGGLFKGMTQAVRNGFLQANSDGQNLDPSIDALYEVKNILSPVGRVAALTLRPLGALFKSKKRNEPLSREEEKHNKKEIKLLERIARMGGGGGGLLGGLLGRGGGLLLRMVAGPIIALAAAFFGGFKIGQIINEKIGGWIAKLIEADIPKRISDLWNGFITKLSDSIPDLLKDAAKAAFEATPFGAAQKAGSAVWDWIKEKVTGTNVPKYLLQKQHGGYGVDAAPASDSGQSAGGAHKPSGKAGKNFTPEKAKKIAEVANRIGVTPNDLASIISFETAGSFSPSAKNPKSSATGLLQFMSGSGGTKGKYYGMTRDQFSGLSFDEQMNYVEKYYKDRGFDGKTKRSLADAYTAVTGYGYKKGTQAYDLNSVWDTNGNNVIDKGEMVKSKDFQAHQKDYYQDQPVTQSSAQPTITPKATALPPTISKPPVVPSLSLKPTINMKAQPIQFRSAAKVEAIPKIESVPEMHTSPKPMLVQSVNSGDNIGQNLSDRGLAHLVTGGLGENRYGA